MSSHTEPFIDTTDKMLQAATRRARLAPILSWVAAGVGLGLVLLFMGQSGFFSVFMPKQIPIAITIEKPQQITGEKSRISGFDKEQQPYEVTAQKGYQDKDNADLAHLEMVVFNFRKKSGEAYQMLSQTAVYDSKGKQLDMQGDVKIIQAGKFTATMDKAHVDMQTKDLVSNVAVNVETGTGTIKANGMKITNDGKTIVFLNGVKARFEEAAKKGDEAP